MYCTDMRVRKPDTFGHITPGKTIIFSGHSCVQQGRHRVTVPRRPDSRRVNVFVGTVGSTHCLQAVGSECGLICNKCGLAGSPVCAECKLKPALVCKPACDCLQAATPTGACAPPSEKTCSCREKTVGYCWRIYFKVLGVLFLASVSQAFLPSKKACGAHPFRHF
jgi:hypothetical protein